jgi:hypothetical protein
MDLYMVSIKNLILDVDGYELTLDQEALHSLIRAAGLTLTSQLDISQTIAAELTEDMPNDPSVSQDDFMHAIEICRKHSCPYLTSLLDEYYFGVTGSGTEILRRLANYLAYKLRDFPSKMLLGESATSVLKGFNDMCGALNAIALESKQKKHNAGAQLRLLAAIKNWMRYLSYVDNLLAQKEMALQEAQPVETIENRQVEKSKTDKQNRFVLIVGNVIDGLSLYGPFASSEEAGQYAEATGFVNKDTWIVVHMYQPD